VDSPGAVPSPTLTVAYEWRDALTNDEVNALHPHGYGYPPVPTTGSPGYRLSAPRAGLIAL